jgi:hypothetical protein
MYGSDRFLRLFDIVAFQIVAGQSGEGILSGS